MVILGIIPARGGSKSVPRKNIRPLGGRPLLAYTIDAALASCLDRVIVSTDDPEIADVACACGAEVPFMRPSHLADDMSSSLSVLLHALAYVETQERYYPEGVAFLQPTSPFRSAAHIDAAIHLLRTSEVESVIGICEVAQHPFVMFTQQPGGRLIEFLPIRPKPLRRQELPPLYVDNGALMVSRRGYYANLADPEPVYSWQSLQGVVMDRLSSIDIDTEFDLLVAEAVLPLLARTPPAGPMWSGESVVLVGNGAGQRSLP